MLGCVCWCQLPCCWPLTHAYLPASVARACCSPRSDRYEEHPVKTLDELFKKTAAKPCIYWLPLSGAGAVRRLTATLGGPLPRCPRALLTDPPLLHPPVPCHRR